MTSIMLTNHLRDILLNNTANRFEILLLLLLLRFINLKYIHDAFTIKLIVSIKKKNYACKVTAVVIAIC